MSGLSYSQTWPVSPLVRRSCPSHLAPGAVTPCPAPPDPSLMIRTGPQCLPGLVHVLQFAGRDGSFQSLTGRAPFGAASLLRSSRVFSTPCSRLPGILLCGVGPFREFRPASGIFLRKHLPRSRGSDILFRPCCCSYSNDMVRLPRGALL